MFYFSNNKLSVDLHWLWNWYNNTGHWQVLLSGRDVPSNIDKATPLQAQVTLYRYSFLLLIRNDSDNKRKSVLIPLQHIIVLRSSWMMKQHWNCYTLLLAFGNWVCGYVNVNIYKEEQNMAAINNRKW